MLKILKQTIGYVFSSALLISCGGSDSNSDNTPPVITLNGDKSITLQQGGDYIELGATANDDKDGVVSVTITGSVSPLVVGNYVITYTATDSSGNTSSSSRNIEVIPDAPPTITLNGNTTMTLWLDESYEELGATATDDVDQELVIEVSGYVDTSVIGSYLVDYSVTDSFGNTSSAQRNVFIAQQPEIEEWFFTKVDANESLDLITISSNDSGVLIHWQPNTAADGMQKQIQLIDFIPDQDFRKVSVYDADNNGFDDLFIATKESWYLYKNLGNAIFSEPQNILNNWAPLQTTAEIEAVLPDGNLTVVDMNGDGIADLTWSSFYKDTTGEYLKLNHALGKADGSYGDIVVLNTGSFYTTNEFYYWFSFIVSNYDDEGNPDIIVSNSSFHNSSDPYYTMSDFFVLTYENNQLVTTDSGYGSESSSIVYDALPIADEGKLIITNYSTNRYPDELLVDLDKNGSLDSVTVEDFEGSPHLYLQHDAFNSGNPGVPFFEIEGYVQLQDLNGDGFIDFFTLTEEMTRIQLYQASGVYSEKQFLITDVLKQGNCCSH